MAGLEERQAAEVDGKGSAGAKAEPASKLIKGFRTLPSWLENTPLLWLGWR